jgi:nitrite reductase/ring-hydroxylating ferredoxin subunit
MRAETGADALKGWRRLCVLADVADGGSAGFAVEGEEEPLGVMVIRRGADIRVYVNRCPHVRLPLDIVPGRFLDRERARILCANHGATFRIEDGHCLAGPCRGRRLIPVPVRVRAGAVWIPAPVKL